MVEPVPPPVTPVVNQPPPVPPATLNAVERLRLTSHISSLVDAALEMADAPGDEGARRRFDDARKWLDRTVDSMSGVIV